MREYAWVVFTADGDAIGIDSNEAFAAWREALGELEHMQADYEARGYRCLRVKLVEVGP